MVKGEKEKPLHSLIAGTTAGAVEAFITYPTEYVKTRSQFGGQRESPISIVRSTLQTKGLTGLYSGCTALVIGNSVKAGVRFVSYDHFKHMLADPEGKVSPARSLLAGLGAGVMEAIFAVTPSETIKTKLIDDAKSPNPKYRGLIHGTSSIVRDDGIRGIYRGLFPVSNSRPGQQLPSSITFGIGAIAGLVTVYTTMPLEKVSGGFGLEQRLDSYASW
ncbi:hypothetical protein PHLCEN_2v7253 [Hermanssonia centrifuga]|uniref:Tricarboxylate transport protein n=1 Tax=Hermanssonia centrifuga TaxID=98765 RepID=A0A2R6NX33_9APHY|nr:hypothetical protein PHLCEN_2v7253 [Hermanssonia centrifuga]